MDRVTPLPGYGASAGIRDASPTDGLGSKGLGEGVKPGGTDTFGNDANANLNKGPEGQIPLSGKRNIEGRPQDREKYQAQTVYFDFDRANVRASEASKVQEVANSFRTENPATDILIEGHCDERGTEEYNRALGERRALAIRELLVASGVPADRVHTVSFGKDKPAEPGHDEAAWAKNRRGNFILILP
jgi:peptidoglycan-associated lipoprotein